jgi:hypothetical protein
MKIEYESEDQYCRYFEPSDLEFVSLLMIVIWLNYSDPKFARDLTYFLSCYLGSETMRFVSSDTLASSCQHGELLDLIRDISFDVRDATRKFEINL